MTKSNQYFKNALMCGLAALPIALLNTMFPAQLVPGAQLLFGGVALGLIINFTLGIINVGQGMAEHNTQSQPETKVSLTSAKQAPANEKLEASPSLLNDFKYGKSTDFWYVQGLGISKGHYKGDCEKAILAIDNFCSNKTLTCESFGHGYGSVTIEGKEHHYNPYGIDIDMMLAWCALDLGDKNENSPEKKTKTSLS